MTITISRAGPEDVEALAVLFDEYRRFYNQHGDIEGAKTFLRQRMEEESSVVFLARDGEKAVGFTQLYPMFSSIRMRSVRVLNDLYVIEEARRQGVGRALMEAARQWAVESGDLRLELATARDNYTAKSLYQSLGYILDDTFEHYALEVE